MGSPLSGENTAGPYSPSRLRVLCRGEGTRQKHWGHPWGRPGEDHRVPNGTFVPKRQQACRHASAGGIEND